jgi:hypothetical protein
MNDAIATPRFDHSPRKLTCKSGTSSTTSGITLHHPAPEEIESIAATGPSRSLEKWSSLRTLTIGSSHYLVAAD